MSEPLALLLLSSTGPQYSHYWTLDTFLGVLGTGPAAGGEGGRVRVGWDMAQGTLGVPGLHSPFSPRGRICWWVLEVTRIVLQRWHRRCEESSRRPQTCHKGGWGSILIGEMGANVFTNDSMGFRKKWKLMSLHQAASLLQNPDNLTQTV